MGYLPQIYSVFNAYSILGYVHTLHSEKDAKIAGEETNDCRRAEMHW